MSIPDGWQRYFPGDVVASWRPRPLALKGRGATQVVTMGAGPPLVAIPPLVGWKEAYIRQAAFLAQRRRFITFDLREPGRGERLSWEGMLEDVSAVVEVEASEPVVLLGHSLGGALAVAWTLAHPERVRALVLSSTFARLTFGPAVWWNRFAAQGMALAANAGLPRSGAIAVARGMARADLWIYDRLCDDTMLDFIRWSVRHVNRRAARQRAAIALSIDLRRRLAELTRPTLVIWGEAEPSYTRRAGRHLARAIAGAESAVVPGANHLGPLTNPERYNAIIETWLDGGATPRESPLAPTPGPV